jgi:AraC family transcriptional regulator of adaptative response/methylated-DNA-[protein]-cysteine methyltransferase
LEKYVMTQLVMKPTASMPRTEDDPRWQAVLDRDKTVSGFYIAVLTTGVYCRPGCPARTPHPKNVRFYTTRQEAELAGFRPCLRCKPDQPPMSEQYAAMVAELCRSIEEAEETPDLASLAEIAGLSPYYVHRVFKAVTGVTPRQYAIAHRANRARAALRKSPTVTDAIYDAGFNSGGRFYANAGGILGMTPTTYRQGGAQTEIRFAIGECSLGSILVASSEAGVCAIMFGDDPDALVRHLEDDFPRARLVGGDEAFEELVGQVVAFVEEPAKGFNLPLDIRGTAFQQRVWQALREIPLGSTVSYSDIAQRIGAPSSVRAVAQACGANKLPVAIPCHRVVAKNGDAGGYRWGVERKEQLLARERTR